MRYLIVLLILVFLSNCSNAPSSISSPVPTAAATPSATDSGLTDVERIGQGNEIADRLEDALKGNAFITSLDLVSVIPLRENINQYSVGLEVTVKTGENTVTNATTLRLQTLVAFGDEAVTSFDVILNDGNQASSYTWDDTQKDWLITQLTLP